MVAHNGDNPCRPLHSKTDICVLASSTYPQSKASSNSAPSTWQGYTAQSAGSPRINATSQTPWLLNTPKRLRRNKSSGVAIYTTSRESSPTPSLDARPRRRSLLSLPLGYHHSAGRRSLGQNVLQLKRRPTDRLKLVRNPSINLLTYACSSTYCWKCRY